MKKCGTYINEILFSLKRKGHFTICCNRFEFWEHYAKWNKPVIERQIVHDSTYRRNLNSQIHWIKEWNGSCKGAHVRAVGINHMPMYLEGVFPISVMGDRPTNLSPGGGLCSDPWTGPSSFSVVIWESLANADLDNLSPIDERIFVEIQNSGREFTTGHKKQKQKQKQVYPYWRR